MQKGRREFGVIAAILLSTALLAVPATAQDDNAVAIVVHPDVAVDDLPFNALRSIFMGEQQRWGDGSRITLLVRAAQAPERDLILSEIYQMNEDRYRQYWIAKMFRAEVAAGPKIVFSTDMTRELVAVIPGSIGFVPASEVGPGMKVIQIDGQLPADPEYRLR
jgi:ABC-type phosphate transport system substrate-binding protein